MPNSAAILLQERILVLSSQARRLVTPRALSWPTEGLLSLLFTARKRRELTMVNRSQLWNSFEFVTIAALRNQQLQRGCTPRVNGKNHKQITIAQMEVVAGK